MPTRSIRVILFVSSYWPLFFILGGLFFFSKAWSHGWVISVICALLCFVGPLGFWCYLRYSRKRNQHKFTVLHDYQRRDNEVMSYIASYIVPLATFSLDPPMQIFVLITFLLLLLILYVNSNMIYINPMLNVAGYHLYEIEVGNKEHYYYLARKRLVREETIDYVHISDEIWLELK